MNDQSQIISQAPQLMNQSQMLNQPPQVMMNPPPPPPPSQLINQSQLMGQSQILSQPQLIPQSAMFSQSQPPMMNMNRSYKTWQSQQDPNPSKKFHGPKPGFGRSNWKGKKPNDMHKDSRKVPNQLPNIATSGGGGGGYKPPTLNELQSQNRLKARKFYPKKKFNNRFAPYAPRNTTSFIMRAKKSGGIASLVSPCPVTPAVLPTPMFSPSREVLVDMAKEEWGVDGYGSMKGLIRLRNEAEIRDNDDEEVEEDENEEDNNGSSESDVEEEKNSVLSRLDHEMSRFEMVYPNYGMDYNNLLENRVDDQDSHIAQLEEENLTLKERLFLMERELGDLRRRLQFLERQNQRVEDVNEEVVENISENGSEEGSDVRGMVHESKEEAMEYVDANIEAGNFDVKDDDNVVITDDQGLRDACIVDVAATEPVLEEGPENNNDSSNKDAHEVTNEVRNEQIRDLSAL